MKKLMFAALLSAFCVPQAAQAEIIAGWDFFNAEDATTTAQFLAPGIDAEITGHNMTRFSSGRGSSIDGTFGAIAGPPNASTVGDGVGVSLAAANGDSESVSFTVTNNTLEDLSFETFQLDAIGFRSNGARTLTLFLGDIATGTALNTPFLVNTISSTAADLNGGSTLHEEVSLDISSLANLAVGGTYAFELALTGGTPGSSGNDSNIDNIAFTASPAAVIPEPGSLALLSIAGVCGMIRRRR